MRRVLISRSHFFNYYSLNRAEDFFFNENYMENPALLQISNNKVKDFVV